MNSRQQMTTTPCSQAEVVGFLSEPENYHCHLVWFLTTPYEPIDTSQLFNKHSKSRLAKSRAVLKDYVALLATLEKASLPVQTPERIALAIAETNLLSLTRTWPSLTKAEIMPTEWLRKMLPSGEA